MSTSKISNTQIATVPDKYNGDLLDKTLKNIPKYSFNIDYLKLNLVGSPQFNNCDVVSYCSADYGSKAFKERGTITYQGMEVGTLEHSPRSAVLNENLCQFKLENALFYILDDQKLKILIKGLINEMGLKFHGINRLDLALDFSRDNHDVEKLLNQINNRDVLISGRPKEIKFFGQTSKGQLSYTGVQVGSRKNSRFLRIYNKTLEQDKTPKTYIKDKWQRMGLTGEIWRFEYQLSSKYMAAIEGLTLEKLIDETYLFELLKSANNAHFELKENTGKSEINKENPFEFLTLEKVRLSLDLAKRVIVKIRRVIVETTIGQKRMVKGLLRSYFSSGQNPEYIAPVERIITDYSLFDWFTDKVDYYLDEFRKKQIIKEMDLKIFENHLNYKSWY